MSTATMQLQHDSDSAIMFRQPLAPILSTGTRHSTDDLKLTFSSPYPSISATRSYSDNDDERYSLCQRRKYSVPLNLQATYLFSTLCLLIVILSRSITRPPPHGRRRSRNSPVIPPSHTPNRSCHGSQRRTSLPALHFHETKVTTLHLDTPMPKHGDAIPEDIYRQLTTYTFGSPDLQRASQYSSEEYSLNDDEDEKMRDSRAKRRNTSRLPRDSQTTSATSAASIRPQSSLSSFSSAGIVVGEVQMDDQSEPDWNTVMNDAASRQTPSRPSSSLDNVSIRSEPRRPSLASLPVLRRQSRSADELKSNIDQLDVARTPTQSSFRSSAQHPAFDWSNPNSSGTTEAPAANYQAYADFDLSFIFDRQGQKPTALSKPSNRVQNDDLDDTMNFQPLPFVASDISLTGVVRSPPLKGQASTGNLFSRLKAKVKPPSSPNEDTFMKHIMDDPEWTFRRISQTEYHPKIKDNENGHKPAEGPEGWWCEPVGKFFVYKTWTPSRFMREPPPNAKSPYYNRLHISRQINSSSNRVGVPPVTVHRHSQVQGFSIYRCHASHTRQPTMDPIDSILLATKSVLRQYTRTRSTRALKTHGLTNDVKPSSNARQTRSADSGETTNGPSTVIGGLDRPSAFTGNRHMLLDYADQGMLISPEPSRPTTASSVETHRPLSLATDSCKTLEYPQVISSSEHILSQETTEPSSPRSPRFSTSHAEAFAMITDSVPVISSTSHVVSAPHTQKSPWWAKAFSSKPSTLKDLKEPASPATDDDEDHKREKDFVGPWLKIAPRAERVEAERQVKQVSHSFECVGLIPPHEKKKSNKPRTSNDSAIEECETLSKIASDSMCMLLPLWPEHTESPTSSHASFSRRSFGSGHSLINKPALPLEARKYLLVSYVPRDDEVGNKRRRQSQNGNSSPRPSYIGAFHATGQILGYEDLRSSGFRLPEKGLCVSNVPKAISLPQEQQQHVMAVCPNKHTGVMIVHEALEAFGFVESAPGGARLSDMGKAVAEMIWCGCITLMTFMS